MLTVHFGDMHIGSTLAMWPEAVPLPDNGRHVGSLLQSWYMDRWREFWADTAQLKQEFDAYCVGISGGDERDGDHHGTTQLVTADEDTQDLAVLAALEIAEPVVDEWHFVRGTPSHAGAGSGATERYARHFAGKGWNVIPNGDHWSHWCYTGNHGGVKMEVAHAPGTKSWVPNTRGVACARHAAYTRDEYKESDIVPPDIVIRHHVHYWQGPGCHSDTCCFFIPAWQAASNWVISRGVKSATESHFIPGGLRLLCSGGRWRHFWWLRRPETGVAWAK